MRSNIKINKRIISPPPEFMPPNPAEYKYQGYWGEPFKGGYQPIISSKVWPDKEKFLKAVYAIELYLKRSGHYVQYRGFSTSRLISGKRVGSGGEYQDNKYEMYWPEDYVDHYIKDHNVMPTERFFKYIIERE